MLNAHREQRDTRRHRRDDSPFIIGAYSVEQIKEFNQRHDAFYGWSGEFGSLYLNASRLPETFLGKVEDLWCDRGLTPLPA